jgi:hypothetical protein
VEEEAVVFDLDAYNAGAYSTKKASTGTKAKKSKRKGKKKQKNKAQLEAEAAKKEAKRLAKLKKEEIVDDFSTTRRTR